MAKKSAKHGSNEWKQHLKDSWTPEKRAAASARQKERMRVKEIRQRQSDAWTPEMRKAASTRVSGTQLSEETKKKIRYFWDQEARDKQSKRRKGTVSAFKGKHHTEEAKQKNREAHLGHITTEETRRKLSIKSSGYHPKRQYGNGEWYIRSDGERIWLRSSYEVRVAKMLDLLHITWKYESKSFDLGDRFYCPDFLLNGLIWWEVKGWMKTEDKTKLIKFSKVYPNENIRIIYLKDIKNLESFNEVTNLDEIYRLGTKIEQI